tara:strand:+ start:29 stop:517 length:489 start_codon:yes stop_codon:yes gene_type:complete
MDGFTNVLIAILVAYALILLLSPLLRAKMLNALGKHHISSIKQTQTESTSIAIGDVSEPGDPLPGNSLSEATVARTAANTVSGMQTLHNGESQLHPHQSRVSDVPLHLDAAVSSDGDRVAEEIIRRQGPENEGRHPNAPPSAMYSYHKDNAATKADTSIQYM